eukprot:1038644-Rhodomonas_salina.1
MTADCYSHLPGQCHCVVEHFYPARATVLWSSLGCWCSDCSRVPHWQCPAGEFENDSVHHDKGL